MNQAQYIRTLFAREDEVLRSIEGGLADRGMPRISVPPETGKTLYLLAKMSGARDILEIGALGGYSTIWLARALPKDGRLISLELKEEHAAFARENADRAGVGQQVEFRVGDASELLNALENEGVSFDFIFIDADKERYAEYLERSIRLARPGAVITADNVLRGGRVCDESDRTPSTVAIRRFNEGLSRDSRLESMLLPVGDGLAVARVRSTDG
ncbi:O-methyltransferase [Planifilum fimeticola]|jgi:caffeoyl-CoA O-methyltransferase